MNQPLQVQPASQAPAQLIELARQVADEVCDPCGMAIGLNVGLAEMGLIRELDVQPGQRGWHVRMRLRLTSPGCQYFFFFREELEKRLLAHPEFASVDIEWDQELDWTPADIALSARSRIEARSRRQRPIAVIPQES
jgi:metal-sulfur cluster biosynthetic enzyme